MTLLRPAHQIIHDISMLVGDRRHKSTCLTCIILDVKHFMKCIIMDFIHFVKCITCILYMDNIHDTKACHIWHKVVGSIIHHENQPPRPLYVARACVFCLYACLCVSPRCFLVRVCVSERVCVCLRVSACLCVGVRLWSEEHIYTNTKFNKCLGSPRDRDHHWEHDCSGTDTLTDTD